MSGHATIVDADPDECATWVSNDGGSANYSVGFDTGENNTGSGIAEGDVVNTSWDTTESSISLDSFGERGEGTVNSIGTRLTISNQGDTDLTGTVHIDLSGNYGSNSGFANKTVSFGNVDGKAAYLKEA